MLKKIAEDVYSKHPSLFIFIVAVCGGVIFHIYSNFALADEVKDEVKKLDKKVKSIEGFIAAKFDEKELADVKRDIYALERLSEKGEATSRDLEHMDNLKIRRAEIERRLTKSKK